MQEPSARPGSLAGKSALVTGAAQGLGATTAKVLAEHGAEVLRVDLSGDGCFVADVATLDGNRAMVEEVVRRHGSLDVLVLNAGVQHVAPIASFPEEQWDRLTNVMLKGPFLALQASWPHLVSSRGRVVVVSSTSGIAADPAKSAYVAAKAGVLGLVRTAALEGAVHGVAVNAVAPGWMGTAMAEQQVHDLAARHQVSYEEALGLMLDRQPVARFVETREVAEVISFLAGPGASGINGACIPVDLGLLAC